MESDDDPYRTPWLGLRGDVELFAPGAVAGDGWTIPVGGRNVAWLYQTEHAFSFEIWLGGEDDLAIRLERPFTLQGCDRSVMLDPRTTRKDELAPLLDLSRLTIASLRVRRTGRLEVSFDGGWSVTADPADDGRAWLLAWPREAPSLVACGPGGKIRVRHPDDPWDLAAGDTDPMQLGIASLEPVRDDSTLVLPLRGPISSGSASSESIELQGPIGGLRFDIHIRGIVRLLGAPDGDLTVLARGREVLGLVGATLTSSLMDAEERLHLRFDDGRVLITDPDGWEAHRPAVDGGRDDHWVPREGPSIP